MTTNIPSQDFNQQIPVFDALPDSWEESKVALVERLRKMTNAINIRPVGWYLDTETITGKRYIPSSGSVEYREISRFTKELGALPNATTKNVAHGLSNVNSNFLLTAMWGAASSDSPLSFIPVPHISVSGGGVEISMDATNFIIKTTSDYSNYNNSVIIIEYTYKV